MSRRSVLFVSAVVAALCSTLLFGSPASAATEPCWWDSGARCAKIIGVSGNLNVRSAPSTGASIVDTLPNGTIVQMDCWTTGTSVFGYNIWVLLYSPIGSPRYVSDYYLDSGHVQSFIDHC
ncbi:SH3 domain-containing protein [Micromonospora sp. NBC_01796]|uniref:SH3 domain-containing protein n=1 Tax=Micromonospora sp. NBC_01796 TaxID=2975987 RepID=UPI002DD85153|nr:SH3 domain-containing protein [Micromonospora sp. NBC_01796]WSA85663.1 SH3 domain-containing protein [Micromonospora sp. NBC_01796]